MNEDYDNPNFDDEAEDQPNLKDENKQSEQSINQNPSENRTDPSEENAEKEICPFCGQPLDQQIINGTTWYTHNQASECQAIFQGISALKEAKDTKQLLKEEQEKAKAKEMMEEKARIVREEAEKPFKEAAQKTADFALNFLEKQLSEIQGKYAAQLNESQEKYTELLKQQQEALTQAQSHLEALLQPKETIVIPDRGLISNAVAAYKAKLNQCADGDPNSQTYTYLENSFNELLACRDAAESFVQLVNQDTEKLKTRLQKAINNTKQQMENAAADGREFASIQKEITDSGQGIVLALEEQLKNLERLFFRKS